MKTTEILTAENLDEVLQGLKKIEKEVKDFNLAKPCIDKWLTAEEVSKVLSKTPRTLHSWRKLDPPKIPYSKIDDSIWYRASDVQNFLMSGYIGNEEGGKYER